MRQSCTWDSEQQGRGVGKKFHVLSQLREMQRTVTGILFFFDAKELEDVGVFWTKALCLCLLHILPPDFWIIYLDTDAVMFDQLLTDLPKGVKPPCIATATEYAGIHNAGFDCIYPTMVSEVKDEVMILSLKELLVCSSGR